MTPVLIRHLVIHTICKVTGNDATDIVALDTVELDTRDWEPVFYACLNSRIGVRPY